MSTDSFRQRVRGNRPLFGLFCMITSPQTAEALGDSGFDFLLFDGEHTPTSLPVLQTQAAVLARSGTAFAVRVAANDATLIKPILDIGIDVLMIPDVRTAEAARAAVRAVRYPPDGIRGVGGMVRATRYGRDSGYYAQAADKTCLVLQIESPEGLANLDAICAVEGVDVLFFGPADLSTNMGLLVQPGAPEVVAAVTDGIRRVRAAGKAAGVLAPEALAYRYADASATMISFGTELGLLLQSADALARRGAQYPLGGSPADVSSAAGVPAAAGVPSAGARGKE